ncbi:MAG: TlpA family protein disulfide reductase [Mucilaginibacter sp.]
MKKIAQIFPTFLISWFLAHGQNAGELLRKADIKARSFHSIAYKTKISQKNPFSEGDTTWIEGQETIVYGRDTQPLRQNILNNINGHQSDSREVFVNDTLYRVDLNDSTYSIDKYPKPVRSELAAFMWRIETALKHSLKNIVRRTDTLINNELCYSFFVNAYDKIEDGLHNFTYEYYYISKSTLMPVYYKTVGAGVTKKKEYVIGRLNFYDDTYFYGYEFDKKYNRALFTFNKEGFTTENNNMLDIGTTAPVVDVTTISGMPVKPSYFKNKVALIEFGSTVCAANPLANPMLNRLNNKYPSSDVSIVGIYSDETADQVKKYIAANDLRFQVYLGKKKLKHNFKTLGTPDFYLIDANGIIVGRIHGYSDELENRIIGEINRLRQQ